QRKYIGQRTEGQWHNGTSNNSRNHQAGNFVAAVGHRVHGNRKNKREDIGKSQSNNRNRNEAQNLGRCQKEGPRRQSRYCSCKGEKLLWVHPVENHPTQKAADHQKQKEKQCPPEPELSEVNIKLEIGRASCRARE